MSLDHTMDRLTTAAHTLINAFGDLRTRGYDKEPNLTAAALDEIEDLTRVLRTSGFGTEGDADRGRVELIESAEEYANHTCTCGYCLHAAPIEPTNLTFTVDA
jgi:hypothetical protein